MELTREQIDIINSSGNIKINAVAGSGKTTTIIEYARSRPKGSRILYLAFNKSVKTEAKKRFAEQGLHQVKVETAHSLAYKYVVFDSHYTVRPQAYRTHEMVEILKIKARGEKHEEFILANHINKFVAYFCNSDKKKVKELNYLDIVFDKKARDFAKKYYAFIESRARELLSKMDKGDIDITHDFYLKKFQLSCPKLPYDYILFDEGQDASPAMLDVFLMQNAVKVIVGDTHQQIYGWRHAVNSLEKADFKIYHLTASFRFSQDIADLATGVLKWKNHLAETPPVNITGNSTAKPNKMKAVLARTNLGLLLKAIEYVMEKKNVRQIYFEGNINSYTYADEGASLYDVLNLYYGKNEIIKDPLIRQMKSLYELEDYIEKTEDVQLAMMVEIVREYGYQIPQIIRELKAKHVENDEKEKAEMIFSTVHRCKGMEYDSVQIVNDFITEEKLEKTKTDAKQEEINKAKLNEEINLLYVAVTRAKNRLYIPEALMPKGLPHSPQIHILKDTTAETKTERIPVKSIREFSLSGEKDWLKKEKSHIYDELRKQHKDAYKPWSQALDDELTIMYCEGVNIKDMAKHFGRTKSAILSRIIKLELEELYG